MHCWQGARGGTVGLRGVFPRLKDFLSPRSCVEVILDFSQRGLARTVFMCRNTQAEAHILRCNSHAEWLVSFFFMAPTR